MTTAATALPKAPMPRKLDDGSKTIRLQLVAPTSWVEQIEEWRATQRPVPNVSAAIRQLVELGLSAKPSTES